MPDIFLELNLNEQYSSQVNTSYYTRPPTFASAFESYWRDESKLRTLCSFLIQERIKGIALKSGHFVPDTIALTELTASG